MWSNVPHECNAFIFSVQQVSPKQWNLSPNVHITSHKTIIFTFICVRTSDRISYQLFYVKTLTTLLTRTLLWWAKKRKTLTIMTETNLIDLEIHIYGVQHVYRCTFLMWLIWIRSLPCESAILDFNYIHSNRFNYWRFIIWSQNKLLEIRKFTMNLWKHTVHIQTADLQVLMPCCLVIGYKKFGGTWCVKMTNTMKTDVTVKFWHPHTILHDFTT